MNITFLIGNGFDVSLGIKSSYGKFYEWYCDKPSNINHIERFRKEIRKDINRDVPDEEKTWADFELGLGKYTTQFTKETVEDFLDCVEDAQANIRTYLKEQEEKFDINEFPDSSFNSFRESLWKFFEEVSDLEKVPINAALNSVLHENKEIAFITFNYTHTLELILKMLPDSPLSTWRHGNAAYAYKVNRNIIHVHGTTEMFPVLGVNDESQIANKTLLETPQFKELLLKAENVAALGQLWHNQAEQLISKSKIICILGMSLGASDAKWWRKLVQWLKADSSRHLIIYWHEKDPPNGVSTRKQLRIVNDTKDKLLSYSGLPEKENATLKQRMHVVINTQRFMALQKIAKTDVEEVLERIEKELATV